MLIPHLHFTGSCESAIHLYEAAFNTKVHTLVTNRQYGSDEDGIAHAEMLIHGQRVMLNDRFGKTDRTTDISVNLVVMFPTKDELKQCYEILEDGSTTIDEMTSLPYSECFVQFIDKYGVQWLFMVGE